MLNKSNRNGHIFLSAIALVNLNRYIEKAQIESLKSLGISVSAQADIPALCQVFPKLYVKTTSLNV